MDNPYNFKSTGHRTGTWEQYALAHPRRGRVNALFFKSFPGVVLKIMIFRPRRFIATVGRRLIFGVIYCPYLNERILIGDNIKLVLTQQQDLVSF